MAYYVQCLPSCVLKNSLVYGQGREAIYATEVVCARASISGAKFVLYKSLICGPFLPFVGVHVIALEEQVDRDKRAQEDQDCQPVPRANRPLKSEMQNDAEQRFIQSN